MWLRSEKRSSRIAHPDSKTSTINLRKIIKNTPALKNLKQTTTTVTSNRRSGVYSTTQSLANNSSSGSGGSSSSSSGNRNNSSSSSKCNIKSRTASVKRLGTKKSLLSKRHANRKKFEATTDQTSEKYGRLRRKSLRNISEMGKENCWQDDGQLDLYSAESKRGRKQRAGGSSASPPVDCASPADDVDSAGANDANSLNVETFSGLVIVNEVCDSCKPSTTCNCSSSSSQTDGSQSSSSSSNDGLTIAKNVGCVNYIECDSTTDNYRTSLPSTSMMATVSVPYGFVCVSGINSI